MAREKQRLINYHTGNLTSMPQASDVDYGEIVVRHNEQKPELLIKVSESEFGIIPGSGAVASAISAATKGVKDYIDGEVNTIEGNITELREAVSGVSTDIGQNYVSKDDFEQAQGELFVSATTVAAADAKKAKEDAIAAAATSANTLQNKIDAANGRIDTVSGNLDNFKATVAETYATKSNVSTDITKAKDAVYLSATTAAAADAKAKADKAKEEAISAATVSASTLLGLIDGVDGRVDTVSGNLDSFKTTVAETYATKSNVSTDITNAKNSVYSSAITAAAADATTKANNAKSDAISAAAKSADTLNKRIDTVDGKVNTLSGNVETAIQNLETGLTETINEKVSRAYRFKGSCLYAKLPTSGSVIGEVWNVTDAHNNIPAGTNYAWDGEKWDALGGSIDLSPYALKTEVTGATKTLQDNIDAANSKINTVSGNLNTFKATVANTYATKSDITTAKDAVYLSATTAAAADATTKANSAQSAAINAAAASANTLNKRIDTVDGKVTGLSASTVTIKATADKAVQTASIVDSDTYKISVQKVGTELQFDFSNLVIDGGSF